jgi:type IV pilus assembly protein PilP
VAVVVALAMAVSACSGGKADLEAYAAEVKARPGPPLDPLPVMQQFETFEYRAFELRDPFSLQSDEQVAQGSGSGPRPDPNRRRELLESFPLDGLSMVGTLGDGSEMIALVMDPASVIHRVSAGNYMGQNEGRVLAISEGQIDLVELVSDGAGEWIPRQASVALDEK